MPALRVQIPLQIPQVRYEATYGKRFMITGATGLGLLEYRRRSLVADGPALIVMYSSACVRLEQGEVGVIRI